MKPYKVSEVRGSEGKQWSVGRNDSLTTIYYFNTKAEADQKLDALKADGIIVEVA